MADFSVNVPEVQGGTMPNVIPTSPAATAGQALGNVANGINDTLGGLMEGRKMHQQLLIKQQTGAAEADLEGKLSTIADAVSSGQLSSAVARTMSRNLTTQAIANNPVLTDNLLGVHKSFMDTPGLGEEVAKGTIQEQQDLALRSKAQEAGWGNPDMPLDQQTQLTHAWQNFNFGQEQLKAQQAQQTYRNSQLDETKTLGDIRNANQAFVTGGINQANARISLQNNQDALTARYAMGSMAQGYSVKLKTDLDDVLSQVQQGKLQPDQAVLAIDQKASALKAVTLSSMPGNGAGAQYANDLTAPMQSMVQSYKDFVSGKIGSDVLANKVAINLGNQKSNITGDQTTARVIATSQLVNNPNLTVGPLADATVKILAQNGDTSSHPAMLTPTTPDGKQTVRDYSNYLLNGMSTITSGQKQGVDPKAMKAEVDTHVNQMLSGIDGYQLAVKNPADYKDVVSMLADPRFGEYMKNNGGLQSDAAMAAKSVLQRDYTDVGVNLMRDEYFKKLNDPLKSASTGPNAVTSAYAPNLQQPEDTTVRAEKITPVFNGSGVTFIPNDSKPDSGTLASVRDLNRQVAPALNQMIRMDAHLSGSTDYKGVWEDHYQKLFQRTVPAPQASDSGN